jgi:hypothetical protein
MMNWNAKDRSCPQQAGVTAAGMKGTRISSNGTSLVEIPVKFLNANSFVVTTRGNMYIDVQ